MQTVFETSSVAQTKKLAKSLVKQWMRPVFRKGALVVGFEGELGSGKTTFIQGAIEGLGVKDRITSPTFVLMKRYKLSKGKNLYHIDCYRLHKPRELLFLGWKEIISNPRNIIFVEWADRVRSILPKNRVIVRCEHFSERKRKISLIGRA